MCPLSVMRFVCGFIFTIDVEHSRQRFPEPHPELLAVTFRAVTFFFILVAGSGAAGGFYWGTSSLEWRFAAGGRTGGVPTVCLRILAHSVPVMETPFTAPFTRVQCCESRDKTYSYNQPRCMSCFELFNNIDVFSTFLYQEMEQLCGN